MSQKKTRRKAITATDMYVSEMLRAMLEEIVGHRVTLTQVLLKYEPILDKEEWGGTGRWLQYPGYNQQHQMEVKVKAYFICLDFPCVNTLGDEMVITQDAPLTPSVEAKVVLVNQLTNAFKWQILTGEIWYKHLVGHPYREHGKNFLFTENAMPQFRPSETVRTLARELERRVPSRRSEKE